MKRIVGIPARMGASRLPGKPLKKICGKTMLEHVYRRCTFAENIDEIFIATCDEEIKRCVEGFGGKAIMTDPEIPRPGLRVAEACKTMNYADDDIIVVVQGDEPLVYPEMIDLAVKPLMLDPSVQLLTLIAQANEEEWLDPNEVKVVIDDNKDILYMSRSPIPSNIIGVVENRWKQVAIMPFQKKFLIDFNDMSSTSLERMEAVELLRAVEHGIKVRTADSSSFKTVSVDTEEALQEAESVMEKDALFQKYKDS